MAILKRATNNVGVEAHYHRIEKITFDPVLDILDITVSHYANEDLRNVEKEEQSKIDSDIRKYYNYKKLIEEGVELGENEMLEYLSLNIQALGAQNINRNFMGITNHQIKGSNIDMREEIYNKIIQTIPLLKNSESV